MADREKVIEGFEMSYRYSNVDDDNTLVPQRLVLDAIALLKAQEPVKPILDSRAIEFYRCGQCNEPIDRCDNYCWSCGRAVKWG